MDPEGEAGGAECQGVEDLDAKLAAKKLEALATVARDNPQTRRGAPDRRKYLGSNGRDAKQRDDDDRQQDKGAPDQAPGRHASLQVAAAHGDVDEGKQEQDERDLDDLLREVVDGSCGKGLRSRCADSLQEANVDAD